RVVAEGGWCITRAVIRSCKSGSNRTSDRQVVFDKIGNMGVTVELQNLGDAQLCQEITAHIEHAFSDRTGQWRVSIAGSRAAENWELRVERPNGFERSYT